jgi:hypothetical protein
MSTRRRFVLVCSDDLASAVLCDLESQPNHAQAAAVRDLTVSLARSGHEVEVWTVQRHGEPAAQVGVAGLLVRRFPGRQEHLVPRVRPCWWVAEWVTCATSHLMTAPAGAAVDATLVTFGTEAGVAGRLLSQRFGFNLVHVPDAGQPAAEFTDRFAQETGETCRCASAVFDAGPDLTDRLLHAIPPDRRNRGDSVALASLGAEPLAEANDSTARGPWLWAGAAANKYAFVGIEGII